MAWLEEQGEMEIEASEFQEWGYCYDEQCEEKKKELITVLKEYKK